MSKIPDCARKMLEHRSLDCKKVAKKFPKGKKITTKIFKVAA